MNAQQLQVNVAESVQKGMRPAKSS